MLFTTWEIEVNVQKKIEEGKWSKIEEERSSRGEKRCYRNLFVAHVVVLYMLSLTKLNEVGLALSLTLATSSTEAIIFS